MKRIYLIASVLMVAASLSAKHYPDSIQQQSQQEPNIAYGWNFEFGGGLGVGSYTYSQLGNSFQPAHVVNKVQFPAWHELLFRVMDGSRYRCTVRGVP